MSEEQKKAAEEVAKIINCLQGTSEAHGEVAAKIMNLIASREQAAAENAARAVLEAAEDTSEKCKEDNAHCHCESIAARTAAAPFMKNKGE